MQGASANALADPVPDALREERRARVMLLQEEISAQRLRAKVGSTIKVLIDEVHRSEAVGRSSADAPEIDGVVHIKRSLVPGKKLTVGEFADVTVTASDAHDLWASVA